ISAGPVPLGSSISVRVPVVLSRPMRLPECSVNQRLPSGPEVIPAGPLLEWGNLTYAIFASGATRPIRLPAVSVNQTAPSGPAVIRSANPPGSILKRLVAPYGVTRPIPSPWYSVNHRLPSRPAVIAYGACVPSGAPAGVGVALGTAAALGPGFAGEGCRAAHPCTIAIAAAKMANFSARSNGPIDASGKIAPRVLPIRFRGQVMLIVQATGAPQLERRLRSMRLTEYRGI